MIKLNFVKLMVFYLDLSKDLMNNKDITEFKTNICDLMIGGYRKLI